MEKIEITKMIDRIFDAVNESKAGPVIVKNDENGIIWNGVTSQILLRFIESELPHINISKLHQSGGLDMKLEEGGEEWKK